MAFRNRTKRNLRKSRKSRKMKGGLFGFQTNANKTYEENLSNYRLYWQKPKSNYMWNPDFNWPGQTNLGRGPTPLTHRLKGDPRDR